MANDADRLHLRSLGTDIQRGEDIQYCELLRLPGTPKDVLYVNRFEQAMTEGSHHLTVTALEPDPKGFRPSRPSGLLPAQFPMTPGCRGDLKTRDVT
jgi:hypothetical protein